MRIEQKSLTIPTERSIIGVGTFQRSDQREKWRCDFKWENELRHADLADERRANLNEPVDFHVSGENARSEEPFPSRRQMAGPPCLPSPREARVNTPVYLARQRFFFSLMFAEDAFVNLSTKYLMAY